MKKFVNEDRMELLLQVGDERLRQDLMYNEELRTPGQWNAILGKQLGQMNEGLLDLYFYGLGSANLRKQLIQVAAVAVAWVEQIDKET